ncbi:NEAT domain-containing protein [Caryophanon latum]|uniref:NEAT domain-containing protein n=1 Tax=Caryophanon latum TaxID=33977 RepID=A0A1C0Z2P3_9BACL|nr:NEAT domain-containing protein [Caryophanon latum]OCS93714.1 hypothetical protein A6K76_04815 [Caryophanon latum]
MLKKVIVSCIAFLVCVAFYLPNTSHAKLADGVYTIEYQVNAYGKDSPSVGNDYFLKPAKLTVKDGKMTAEMTVKNAAWVVKLEPPGYKLINENKAADQRTFQMDVAALNKAIVVPMRIEIPNLEYYHSYNVDFVFDEAKAKKTGDVVASTKPVTTTPAVSTTTAATSSATAEVAKQLQEAQKKAEAKPIESTSTTKPATTSTTAKTTAATTTTKTQVKNPQTSDELPYVALLLLVASAFVIVRLRKQTA